MAGAGRPSTTFLVASSIVVDGGPAQPAPAMTAVGSVALLPDFTVIQPYALSRAQAAELAATIGVVPDLHSLDLFVEADEDWQAVAAKRDALRAVG
jgi:hypothetical protein